jgi:hypothetical protein
MCSSAKLKAYFLASCIDTYTYLSVHSAVVSFRFHGLRESRRSGLKVVTGDSQTRRRSQSPTLFLLRMESKLRDVYKNLNNKEIKLIP